MVRVKVCGLTRPEDVESALDAGADAVGFVRHPESPRCQSTAEAVRLAESAGPYVARFLVYRDFSGEDVPPGFFVQARSFVSGLNDLSARRVFVLPVGLDATVSKLLAASERAMPNIEAFLLDTCVGGSVGGSGQVFDWGLAAEFVNSTGLPTVLAGGLTPENVAEAIRRVRPYAVDVSSGVESAPGIKDPVKIRDFVQAAKSFSAT